MKRSSRFPSAKNPEVTFAHPVTSMRQLLINNDLQAMRHTVAPDPGSVDQMNEAGLPRSLRFAHQKATFHAPQRIEVPFHFMSSLR
jgi:hypothetical protein